jgi:LPXTG-motif cell wall-anchored protein
MDLYQQPKDTPSIPKDNNISKEFDPILFLILIAIVGVFVWYDDSFRAVLLDLYDKSLGQLSVFNHEAFMIAGLLLFVLLIYLISRRKRTK